MKAIELISVPVTDQQRSKAFYLKMGLQLIREEPFGPERLWIQLAFPAGGPSITLVNWFDNMPAGSLQAMIVETDDLAGDVDRLKNKGVEMGEVEETPWGKFANIKDPDGNSWSLHQH